MREGETRALAKKKWVKQKYVSSVTTTKPLHTVDRRTNVGETTAEPLTKAKEKMKVKTKFISCSTEKPCEFCSKI